MQILKWLRKCSESLSARGKEARRLSRSNSKQRVETVCQVSASIVLLSDAHFQLSLPLSQDIKYYFTWPEPGKPFQICSLPLVSICLLTWLHSAIPFLKGLSCFAGYILVPLFKSHIFCCRPQAAGK